MKQLVLPLGANSYGAQMGRRNELPKDVTASIKLRMSRLQLVDGDYDKWGAYWGAGTKDVYCAWNGEERVKVFVRGMSRTEAKENVQEILPNAKFFR